MKTTTKLKEWAMSLPKVNFRFLIFVTLSSMLSHLSAFSQTANIANLASVDAIGMPLPSNCVFEDFEMAYLSNTSNSSGKLVAAVYGSKTGTSCSGITVYDNGSLSSSISFYSLTVNLLSSPLTSSTHFFNPDIILLQNGLKAIVTVETDDGIYGSYVFEFDINPTTLAITQGGMQDPIDNLGSLIVSEPRIDGDPVHDKFAITFIENNEVRYSIYKPYLTSYAAISSASNISATFLPPVAPLHPDIAMSFDIGGDPVAVVSYYDYDVSGPTLSIHVEEINSLGITPLLSPAPSLCALNSYSFSNAGYPRIAGENSQMGMSGISGMKWALCVSELVTQAPTTGSHLWYIHSNNLTPFLLDDTYNTSEDFRNVVPSLDWMTTDDDAFPIWVTAHNLGNTADVVGSMSPYYTTGNYYDWDQVNYNNSYPIVGGRTSVSSDPNSGSDNYIVAYSTTYNGTSYILYKIGTMGSPTAFRELNNSNEKLQGINLKSNPSESELNFVLNLSSEVFIYDMAGKLIKKQMCQSGKNIINVDAISSGIYILRSQNKTLQFTIKR